MSRWVRQLIEGYFRRTEHYSLRRFIAEMALVPFPLKILLGVGFAALGGEVTQSTTDAVAKWGPAVLLGTAIIVAPLLETLIGQWLPIWVASRFTNSTVWIIAAATFVFSIQHVHVGVVGLLTALPPGIFLAWSFLLMRRHSRWRAYWVTSVVHSLHNAVALIVYCCVS